MIQVFGTGKNRDTQKAIRFFKERRVPFQFIDLAEKSMSRGELESVMRSIPIEDLLDRDGVAFRKEGYEYKQFDPVEELLEKPRLFKMPVVRDKNRATVGMAEAEWLEWINH
jgi:arsenate reductase (glutaredoxin)